MATDPERKREQDRQYRERNRDRIRAYQAEYKQRNRERLLESGREYRARPENKEHMRQYLAEYNAQPEAKQRRRELAARPETRERSRQYDASPERRERKRERESTPEAREQRRQYRQRPEVKARNREYARERNAERYANDPEFRERKKNYEREYYYRNPARRQLSIERLRAKSPEDRWREKLWSSHRMHPAQWEAMFAEQDGKCYLCMQLLPDDRRDVHIDHDHGHCPQRKSCNLCRRGLACESCNLAIGHLADSPERLRIIADNLERAQTVTRALTAFG